MNSHTTAAHLGLIEHLKARLLSPDFLARYRQAPRDFTRQRCLTFVVLIVFLLNLLKRSAQDELDEFFKLLQGTDVAVRWVTKSALTQARKKLKAEAFIELNQVQTAYFYHHLAPHTWHGWRLLAVDGSTLRVPNTPENLAYFGVLHPAQGAACPLARVSQLFDVLNDLTLDALIAPLAQGERELAAAHLAHVGAGDLVLLDRGYPAFWLFALILSRQAQICARMQVSGWTVVKQFVASGLSEQIVVLAPTAGAAQECRDRQLSDQPLTLRLIRVELADGEVEVLATSLLDSATYPVALFKDLYHQRWPVEEQYKIFKCRLEIENFSGTSRLAVCQDFHAKVLTANLTAILARPAQTEVAQNSAEKKYAYQVNMTQALSKMKDTVVLLFHRADIRPLLHSFWQVLSKTIEPIRPNRSYPRKKRVKPHKFPVCYKPVR